jgi:hypothetical protein
MSKNKADKVSLIGAGGSAGIAGLIGACGGTCGAAALPLGSFLTSIGLGSFVGWLPAIGKPLFFIGLALGLYSIYRLTRVNRPILLAFTSVIMTAMFGYSGYQLFNQPCSSDEVATISKMSNDTKIVAKTIYSIWPELGKAPTPKDLSSRLKIDEKSILKAYQELRSHGFTGMFYSGSDDIKWFWPLSTIDHGFMVTLAGKKQVFARCSIDALGMSAMYDLPATIEIITPIEKKKIRIQVDGEKIVAGDSNVIVTQGKGCNDMLLFANHEEFQKYIDQSGKKLKGHSLEEGLKYGVKIFKNRLRRLNI